MTVSIAPLSGVPLPWSSPHLHQPTAPRTPPHPTRRHPPQPNHAGERGIVPEGREGAGRPYHFKVRPLQGFEPAQCSQACPRQAPAPSPRRRPAVSSHALPQPQAPNPDPQSPAPKSRSLNPKTKGRPFYRIIEGFIDQAGAEVESVFGGEYRDDAGAWLGAPSVQCPCRLVQRSLFLKWELVFSTPRLLCF